MNNKKTIPNRVVARRIFKARGSHVKRCQQCLMALGYCICSYRSAVETRAQFSLLMHPNEQYKPTNTGRLIRHCISDCSIFYWSRKEIAAEFLELLRQDNYQPWLVFPNDQSDYQARVCEFGSIGVNKNPFFILLDGTWRQARRIFRQSTYLTQLPILSLQQSNASSYRLRQASNLQHLCTAEVAICLLQLNTEEAAAQHLQDYYTVFQLNYLASRMNQAADLPAIVVERLLKQRVLS